MSQYVKVKTVFVDQECLVDALSTVGNWSKDHIQVSAEPQHLFGYRNDQRQQTAHIVINRRYVGSASNDIGFERCEDGSFVAHISEYDKHKYNDAWMVKLKEEYGFRVIERQQRARGRTVTRQRLPNGRQRVVVEGFR